MPGLQGGHVIRSMGAMPEDGQRQVIPAHRCTWRTTAAGTLLSHVACEERELTGPLARYGFCPGQV
jgi:hypothetical protein